MGLLINLWLDTVDGFQPCHPVYATPLPIIPSGWKFIKRPVPPPTYTARPLFRNWSGNCLSMRRLGQAGSRALVSLSQTARFRSLSFVAASELRIAAVRQPFRSLLSGDIVN